MRELAEGTLLKALPDVVLIHDSYRDRFTVLIGKNRKELMKARMGRVAREGGSEPEK